MFRLSREVRFAGDSQSNLTVTNGHAGYPTLQALKPWFALRVTLSGKLNARTSYLRNIQEIDAVVRAVAIPIVDAAVRSNQTDGLMARLCDSMKGAWPGATLDELELALSPFTELRIRAKEYPMIRLSQKFEFSASHRLHNEAMSDAENRASFGKCNNPAGHGHNYEVQVTVRRESENLSELPKLEALVKPVIDRFDHRHLNVEVAEFQTLNPTVENIAKVIFEALKPVIGELVAVTVWETPKTWCEYGE